MLLYLREREKERGSLAVGFALMKAQGVLFETSSSLYTFHIHTQFYVLSFSRESNPSLACTMQLCLGV